MYVELSDMVQSDVGIVKRLIITTIESMILFLAELRKPQISFVFERFGVDHFARMEVSLLLLGCNLARLVRARYPVSQTLARFGCG